MTTLCYLVVFYSVVGAAIAAPAAIAHMRTEYLENPLGLDTHAPRFSFQVVAAAAARVEAYTLDVFNAAAAPKSNPVWTSGKVRSAVTHNIRYGTAGAMETTAPAVPLKSGHRYTWIARATVTTTAVDGTKATTTITSPKATFSMGILNRSNWNAQFVGMASGEVGVAPWFRKTFAMSKDTVTENAFLFVASLGFCEVTVNGNAVTVNGEEAVLLPSISYLPSRILYRTYDVGPLLRPGGNNTIGLWASAGWADYMSFAWAIPSQWKKAPLVMAELRVGDIVLTATDAEWECRQSTTSRLGNWGNGGFGGDLLDLSLAVPGWDTPEGKSEDEVSSRLAWETATVYPIASNMTISADVMEPTVKHSRVSAVSVAASGLSFTSKNYTVIMSELYTGWFEISNLHAPPHSTIQFYVSTTSGVASEWSMVDALTLDASGVGNFRMRFSYHEIHYIVIEGLSAPPEPRDVTGWRLSIGLTRTGAFDSSNSLLNRIYNTTVNNYLGLTTGGQTVDCPHRERRGYGGDGHTSYQFALANFHVGSYFTKWARDFADVQQPSGEVPFTAPTVSGGGGPAWSGFVVTMPWEVYRTYGDTSLLASMYPTMQKQLAFYATKTHASDGLLHAWVASKWYFLGDWITPHGSEANPTSSENILFNNCYLHYITALTARIAKILGKSSDAQQYRSAATALAAAINKAFYDPATGAYVDHLQTHLLMPLATGVVPVEQQASVLASLEAAIAKTGGHLDTGLTGNYFMTKYFTEVGRNDLMLGITNKTTFPSYGYFLEQGYTTWPETWNVETCCSQQRLSKMHGCYNAVGLWFVQGIAGIDIDHSREDGYAIVVRAGVDIGGDGLLWATGTRAAPQGLVHSSWSTESVAGFTHNVTVPGNALAKVLVPGVSVADVMESGKPLPAAGRGIKVLGEEVVNGVAYVAVGVGAGTFVFTSTWSP
jgi:hypothetical protein